MSSRFGSTSAAIAAGRLLLLGVAAGAVVVGFVAGGDDKPVVAGVSYVCPMHPEVTSASPGDCPICRMALEAKRTAKRQTKGLASTETPTRSAPGPDGESVALMLPEGSKLHAFDSVSLVKRYATSLEMRGHAWAETGEMGYVLLHGDESELLAPNEAALFYPLTRPTDGSPPGIKVHLTDEPATKWDGATTLVRFNVDAGATLSPGQTGSIKLATRLRNGLVVRSSAILRSSEGPYVLVVSADRKTLTKRPVEIGNVVYGYAAIVAGLRENELVAAKRTFFLDAERRLGTRSAL